MLSKEFETPMHMYDIPNDKLIELDEGVKTCISKDAEMRKIPMSLKLLIKMHGGKYAKKILVTAKEMGDVYLERAAEMGIEVR